MAREVAAVTPPEVHCGLLLVDCAELKATLHAKAEALALGVGGLVVEELSSTAASLVAATRFQQLVSLLRPSAARFVSKRSCCSQRERIHQGEP